jgi:hypothetical protein
MHWRPKTKILADIERSRRRIVKPIEARKKEQLAKLTQQQRLALQRAQQAYIAAARKNLLPIIGGVLPPAHQLLLPVFLLKLMSAVSHEAQQVVTTTIASGVPPDEGNAVASAFKIAARDAGWPPAAVELTGEAVGQLYNLAQNPARKTLVAAIALIAPQVIRKRGQAKDREGIFEREPLELAA